MVFFFCRNKTSFTARSAIRLFLPLPLLYSCARQHHNLVSPSIASCFHSFFFPSFAQLRFIFFNHKWPPCTCKRNNRTLHKYVSCYKAIQAMCGTKNGEEKETSWEGKNAEEHHLSLPLPHNKQIPSAFLSLRYVNWTSPSYKPPFFLFFFGDTTTDRAVWAVIFFGLAEMNEEAKWVKETQVPS